MRPEKFRDEGIALVLWCMVSIGGVDSVHMHTSACSPRSGEVSGYTAQHETLGGSRACGVCHTSAAAPLAAVLVLTVWTCYSGHLCTCTGTCVQEHDDMLLYLVQHQCVGLASRSAMMSKRSKQPAIIVSGAFESFFNAGM